MKQIFLCAILLFAILCVSSNVRPQEPEDIINKSKTLQSNIIMKNLEHQKKILEQVNKFFEKVKKFAPGLKLQIPIKLAHIDEVKEAGPDMTKIKTEKIHYAYVGEPYRLRTHPSDSDMEKSTKVTKGTKVQVLMMPEVDEKTNKQNATDKWVLVKTPSGVEGYIPLDMLLSSPPQKGGVSTPPPPMVKGSVGDSGSDFPKKMRVTVSTLNVRYEPNMNSGVADKVYKGYIVDVLSLSDNTDYIDGQTAKWARIRYLYLEGWVFSGYLSDDLTGQDTSPSGGGDVLQTFSVGESLYVKSDILRVRDAPSDEGTVLFSLHHRDRIEVEDVMTETVSLAGRKSKWVSVKYNDNDGWVFGAFLSKSSSGYEEGDDISKLFIFPFNDPTLPITSNYGWRTILGMKNFHNGIDIGASTGTPILAAADGKAILTKVNMQSCNTCGYGTYIVLEHKNGNRTLYGHLSALNITDGQKVLAGDTIGKVGSTGFSTGPHLHFEIRANEEFVDPITYLHALLDDFRDVFMNIADRITSFFRTII